METGHAVAWGTGHPPAAKRVRAVFSDLNVRKSALIAAALVAVTTAPLVTAHAYASASMSLTVTALARSVQQVTSGPRARRVPCRLLTCNLAAVMVTVPLLLTA
jgi:hypothetical protein